MNNATFTDLVALRSDMPFNEFEKVMTSDGSDVTFEESLRDAGFQLIHQDDNLDNEPSLLELLATDKDFRNMFTDDQIGQLFLDDLVKAVVPFEDALNLDDVDNQEQKRGNTFLAVDELDLAQMVEQLSDGVFNGIARKEWLFVQVNDRISRMFKEGSDAHHKYAGLVYNAWAGKYADKAYTKKILGNPANAPCVALFNRRSQLLEEIKAARTYISLVLEEISSSEDYQRALWGAFYERFCSPARVRHGARFANLTKRNKVENEETGEAKTVIRPVMVADEDLMRDFLTEILEEAVEGRFLFANPEDVDDRLVNDRTEEAMGSLDFDKIECMGDMHVAEMRRLDEEGSNNVFGFWDFEYERKLYAEQRQKARAMEEIPAEFLDEEIPIEAYMFDASSDEESFAFEENWLF